MLTLFRAYRKKEPNDMNETELLLSLCVTFVETMTVNEHLAGLHSFQLLLEKVKRSL
jgi:hypothetical protein